MQILCDVNENGRAEGCVNICIIICVKYIVSYLELISGASELRYQ